ncbi:uncharacterized protein Spn85F isoform X2 [Chelonus insularis]|uniref:uncharacterized protein Spn85F isoform X2 n=1 Tax=Chelonus insularis TaxID=460826 RepID=UPI00158AB50A|nr:uncharacterized protein LOC118072603 isoform X2 [Chelonus insularis]
MTIGVVIGHNINTWRPLTRPHENPLNVMTDIINDLGIKLLNCYVERPGNVAFSPVGLAFVLTALYEGSAGHTNRQLIHVLSLPRDRRVTRVGMRDINRKLRSYLNADAFLGGLTLNRDDIMLRPEYEDILRFYGFDVADTTKGNGTINNTVNSTSPDSTTADTNNQTDSMIENIETTTAPILAVPGVIDTIAGSTTASNSLTPATTNPTVEIIAATNNVTNMAIMADIMNENSTRIPINNLETTTVTPSMAIGTITDTNIITTLTTPIASENQTVVNMGGNGNNGDNGMSSMSSVDANVTTRMEMTVSIIDSVTDVNNQTDAVAIDTNDTSNVRRKRSFHHRRLLPVWFDDLNTWQDYPTSDDEFQESMDQQTTELKFLVHGCDAASITTVTYTTVLPFAYFPLLHAIGLEFPLDDPRYNMIIMVPTDDVDAQTLTRIFPSKSLRYLRNSMRSTWVKATIPSFMLRGFITLTPYLQQLGIKDAFEPRAADLSPMSPDLGIYARDVHQSIGVNIRNYLKGNENGDNSTNTSIKKDEYYPAENILGIKEPIPFTADRPFLFFIVDAETSLSLIAGRIDDPLNSRII